jgi:hypothetical protein
MPQVAMKRIGSARSSCGRGEYRKAGKMSKVVNLSNDETYATQAFCLHIHIHWNATSKRQRRGSARDLHRKQARDCKVFR